MRIKYKGPNQLLFRRFWRVEKFTRHADGGISAYNKAGKTLWLPPGMVVIAVGDT